MKSFEAIHTSVTNVLTEKLSYPAAKSAPPVVLKKRINAISAWEARGRAGT